MAARFEVVQLWLGVSDAKQEWIDSFGKGMQDFHDARRVLRGERVTMWVARNKLVRSRWQMVAARLGAGWARGVAFFLGTARVARITRVARIARVGRIARLVRIARGAKTAGGARVVRVARRVVVCDGGDFGGGRGSWRLRQRGVVEAQRVLVGELSVARDELVESRWQVVAARIAAVRATSDGIDFGGGQREVADAQRVMVGELQQTVAELR